MILAKTLLALHLLGATAWVGGMFYALVVLRPSLNILDAAPRLQLHMLTLKRFFLIVWHAMPIMILTGWAMVFLIWGGFGAIPWEVNAMQGLGILMALVFLYAFFGPWQRLRRAIRPSADLIPRIRSLILINLLLGVATIVIAAYGQSPA